MQRSGTAHLTRVEKDARGLCVVARAAISHLPSLTVGSVSRLMVLGVLFCIAGGHIAAVSKHGPGVSPAYDWGVAYYMPYDNNLGIYGRRIIRMIRAGIVSDRTMAAVQADFPGPGGMHRITIQSGKTQEDTIPSDDSADEENLLAYLRWFVTAFPCRRYVVILLDHGGRLDEMCFDEHPDTPGKNWMSGQVLGRKLRELNREIGGRIELLFLQQCARGSVENLYSFRRAAKFIMSSPEIVGAPNTYYADFHTWLARNPDATGETIAETISTADTDYTVYTCVRSSKLAELPGRLDALIGSFLKQGRLITPSEPQSVLYSFSEQEPIVDLKCFFTNWPRRITSTTKRSTSLSNG